MGAVPSTPRWSGATRPQDTAEYLIATYVGEKSFPLGSDYWQKLLELPLNLHWPSHHVRQACELFAQNNCYTRHLAKILIHLAWSLRECVSTSSVPSSAFAKALNALFVSSIFLKYLLENAKSDTTVELYLSLDERETMPNNFSGGDSLASMYLVIFLFHEVILNFLLAFLSLIGLNNIVGL
ncbi:unnamed protein product [Ilex paraguariensis]|uniref:Dymeclin n=1 Tax=Ilex paraguariensis TaxID=185542 RepID=A0ABC8TT11_9AQUA